jgi:hypothetical protein
MILLTSGASAFLSDGLVTYYDFDETTGTNIEDTALGRNNGTLTNTNQLGFDGVIGTAMNLNGTNINILNVSDSQDFNFTNTNFSIGFWINATSDTINNRVFDKVKGTSVLMGYSWNDTAGPNQHRFQFDNTTDDNFLMNSGLTSPNIFQYVFITYNGTLSIYQDGTFRNTSAYNGTLGSNNGDLIFQCQSAPCNTGTIIDELGIWNRSLSATEISDLYGGGSGFSPFDLIRSVLNTPTSNENFLTSTKVFNATLTPFNLNLTNATFNIWFDNGTLFNQSTREVTGTVSNDSILSVSDIPFGLFKWNVLGCGINDTGGSFCNEASTNLTFNRTSYIFNSQTFTTPTVSLSTVDFILNFSYDSSQFNSITANLFYNNSLFSGTQSGTGDDILFTSSFTVPPVSAQTNISFNWIVTLINSTTTTIANSTSNNQSINQFQIDDCSSNTELILNYTLKDEGTTDTINHTTFNSSIEINAIITSTADPTQSTSFSQNYSELNPAQVCLGAGVLGNGTWKFDVQTRYTADTYETEFHNIQNATLDSSNFPQNIDIFPLLTVDSENFLITFKDDSFAPTKDALITVTRKYVGEGLFRTVEAPLTDIDGQVIVHLVIGDVIYTIQVSKEGEVLATFDNIVPFCADVTIGKCEINLDAFSSGVNPTDFDNVNDLSYIMDFDQITRDVTVVFTIPSGAVSTIALNSTIFDNRGNTTACTTQLISSSGTLTCSIPQTLGNVSVLSVLTKDGTIINSATYTIKQDVEELFGGTGYIFLILLYMTLPLILITTGPGMIIGAVLGLIFATLLNLFNTNNIIGVGSTIMWFIIAGGIIAWKASKRE